MLKKLDSGVSCRALAVEIGCGKTQITRIRAEKDSIMKDWGLGCRADLNVKKRKTVYDQLNCLVWEWFCTARSKQLPVSGRLIQVRNNNIGQATEQFAAGVNAFTSGHLALLCLR